MPALLLILVLIACGAGPQAAPIVPTAMLPPLAPATRAAATLTAAATPTIVATVQVHIPLALTTSPSATAAPPSATVAPSPTAGPTPQPAPPTATFQVVNTYPHDRSAFTEGLIYEDGWLYEGTGLNGQSDLRKVKLETGEVVQTRAISDTYFGEGITIFGDKIFQLTYRSQVGFVYDKASFEQIGEFHYPTEGWGLTHDGAQLIMSDGTATLHFLDPQTLQEIGTIDVYDNNGPVVKINELEYINGEVYANIWQTDLIARISPQTGQVLGWIDLTGLLAPEDRQTPVDVLNGIAYDAAGDRLFVTGKWWPKLFQIKLIEP
jgi:glutaminyl-peptide cyclotransferase